ncbi:ANK REP REGION domain-containing protein [Citrus sinensis]|nr:ANK REP REGION domain-containing protein [Citrus sinensis]
MEEASSSSKQEANDQTNVCNCKNKSKIEGGQSSRDPQEHEKYRRHLELYRMIQMNDWQSVDGFVQSNTDILKEHNFLGRSLTIFHLIMGLLVDVETDDEATDLIDKLAQSTDVDISETLSCKDGGGNTVLSLCAIRGNLKASKILVKHKHELLIKQTNQNSLPVHLAALFGHKDTFEYLLEETPGRVENFYCGGDGGRLLSDLIKANLYDVALNLLKNHPEIVHDIDSQKMALDSLALKPYAFESGSRLGCLEGFIYKCPSQQSFTHTRIPVTKQLSQTNDNPNVAGDTENGIGTTNGHSKKSIPYGSTQQITTYDAKWPCFKAIYAEKLTHMRTVEIVRFICENVIWTNRANRNKLKGALFTATRLGIPEFVNEFIMAYNYSALLLNSQNHGIFELAVLHRREKVFNLIHGVNSSYFSISLEDKSGNNILHLTGKSEPSRHVPGAALKMQRELQWFKLAKNLVHPQFREAENKLEQTPTEVFTKEHKELAKEGEKWMKETASSCSVVAALIVTVVFAASFTVPGGHDGRGIPNLLHEPSFMIFAISDMLALFSSITSVLMFLGILTSQYAEEEFLESLPRMLIIGLVTLFFSIASMMVAFGATVHISLHHKWNLVFIPIALVGLVPVTLFAFLQFPLLVDMCSSTYCRGIFIESSWRELNSRKIDAKGKYKKKSYQS